MSKANNRTNSTSTPAPDASVPADTTTVSEQAAGKVRRSFTVVKALHNGKEIDIPTNLGRYESKSPAGAARKSSNRICKKITNERCTIQVTVKETTKGSSRKEYTYEATREPVDKRDVEFKSVSGDSRVSIPFGYIIRLKSLRAPREPKEKKERTRKGGAASSAGTETVDAPTEVDVRTSAIEKPKRAAPAKKAPSSTSAAAPVKKTAAPKTVAGAAKTKLVVKPKKAVVATAAP